MHGTIGQIGASTSPGNGLMRRATIEEIVGKRNKALELYGAAHSALLIAAVAGSLVRR